ncbi:protein phosphatase 1 regulatory subunit 42-like [Amphiura filiformis]|uniref:protein phosphatase 1 regulatory subunit 42-like n=1 Tax=Amphiura filiformis TaxID=82378 RepID=UPI003B2213A7
MVKLTVDLIGKAARKKEESIPQYLKKLTHLYFSEKNIDEIDDLSQCRNLSVLYLYDNKISRIQNLGFAANLTHLYLQNNNISRIENLAPLKKLNKLYLGCNNITVIEGLDRLDQLRELHIEQQNLPSGEKLLFDPRTLAALSVCLQVLNVSSNNLDDIADLRILRYITQFVANDNKLRDMKTLSRVISSWQQLWRLELIGNPLCRKAKYRDRVIVMNESIAVLDGREISDTEKQFLLKWREAKDAKKRQKLEGDPISGHGTRELPPVQPPARGRDLNSIYIMPGLVGGKKQFEAVLAKSTSQPCSAAKTKTDVRQPLGLMVKSHSDLDRPRRRSMPREPPKHKILRDSSPINLPSGDADISLSGQIVPLGIS